MCPPGSTKVWLSIPKASLIRSSQNQLDQAIRSNQLLSVRSLSAGFSEVSDKANLSYSQSYSIVKFLIEAYSQDKMNALLTTLRDGTAIDEALVKVYGFDVDGLEDAWRASDRRGTSTCFRTTNCSGNPDLCPNDRPGLWRATGSDANSVCCANIFA